MRSAVNNGQWNFSSKWWTNRVAYNTGDRSGRKNVKKRAFYTKRVKAIKIELNRRTFVFSMPNGLYNKYTLRDLVNRAAGLQFASPGWRKTRFDVFGFISERDPRSPSKYYCGNFGVHYTPYFSASQNSKTSHCSAVSRLGLLLSSSRRCAATNRMKPTAAEGLGVWYQCKNYNVGSGRVDSRGKNFFSRATVWVM
jgi:hypothetical protein